MKKTLKFFWSKMCTCIVYNTYIMWFYLNRVKFEVWGFVIFLDSRIYILFSRILLNIQMLYGTFAIHTNITQYLFCKCFHSTIDKLQLYLDWPSGSIFWMYNAVILHIFKFQRQHRDHTDEGPGTGSKYLKKWKQNWSKMSSVVEELRKTV